MNTLWSCGTSHCGRHLPLLVSKVKSKAVDVVTVESPGVKESLGISPTTFLSGVESMVMVGSVQACRINFSI